MKDRSATHGPVTYFCNVVAELNRLNYNLMVNYVFNALNKRVLLDGLLQKINSTREKN